MLWSEVEITDNNGKVLGGGAARSFVEKNCRDSNIKTVLKNSICIQLPGSEEKIVARDKVRDALFNALKGKAKSLAIKTGKEIERLDMPVARVVPNVVNVIPALLRMHLDVDRDGKLDDAPANHSDWTWGHDGHGAVVVVKTRTYLPDVAVAERMPIEFRWSPGTRFKDWEATLDADHGGRIRVFRQPTEGAAKIDLPCNFKTLGPEDSKGVYRLWIEATDYPEVTDEGNWLIKLTFTFKIKGTEKNRQTAVLRIAPWIMASDLDPVHHVFLRTTEGQENPLPDAIAKWIGGDTGVLYPVGSDRSKKGFARDVMKTGYTTAPYYSGIVIQHRLDLSPLQDLPKTAAEKSVGGLITKGVEGLKEPDRDKPNSITDYCGQDNGGNLLVTPPSDEYPWGRILFGGDDDKNRCHSETFYRAQKIQKPLRLDSIWLRVGHVDEMLSFVPDKSSTWGYKVLIISPRLAHTLLYLTSAIGNKGLPEVLKTAEELNSQLLTGSKLEEELKKIGDLGGALTPACLGSAIDEKTFIASPDVPKDSNGRYVIWGKDAPDARFKGIKLNRPQKKVVSQSKFTNFFTQAEEIRTTTRMEDAVRYELRVDIPTYLLNIKTQEDLAIGTIQERIDATRTLLKTELGIKDEDFIEVPVVIKLETGSWVAETGDSVNLLAVSDGKSCKCLIPKPFGPVLSDAYVFEEYLKLKMKNLGISFEFFNDWYELHLEEGEIHCGTNQTAMPLKDERVKWWLFPPL